MMNRAERQAAQYALSVEQKRLNEIKALYERSRKDIIIKITELNNRKDFNENMQTIIYQRQYQQALLQQIDAAFTNLREKEYRTVDEFLRDNYENGFIGTVYSLHEQNIPVIIPIDQKRVTQALTLDSKISGTLYNRLGENVARLKNNIRAEISRGIANGEMWQDAAVRVAMGMNSPFPIALKRTLTIARTEGHRVQEIATLDAAYAARERGASQKKQWDAALDEKTREDHKNADGQIVDLDGEFIVGGEKLAKPGDGSAKQAVNCRCHTLMRAKWALDEAELEKLKGRAAYFGLNKTKEFAEFKKLYMDIAPAQ